MKNAVLSLLLFMSPLCLSAQVDGGEIGEVTVRGSRVVEKRDGRWIYPSEEELGSSPNGYSLLQKLSLPGIKVDVAQRVISSVDNMGGIKMFVNGVPATRQDVSALEMSAVVRVEFIDRPGLRYGEDVAYVINFVTKRATGGYTLGADLMHDLTCRSLSDGAFARLNRGTGEIGVAYTFGYGDMRGSRVSEDAEYTLTSGDVKRVTRYDLANRERNSSHSAQLSYSVADTAFVMQARLSYDHGRERSSAERAIDNDGRAVKRSRQNTGNATLDMYFKRDFRRHQGITADFAVTNIASDGNEFYSEGAPCVYDIDGRTWALQGEVLYDNALKWFNVDVGMNFCQTLTDNRYTGDAGARALYRSSEQYLFGQVSGTIAWLQYTAAMGASTRYYRQGRWRNRHFVLRPKLDVSCPLVSGLRLAYSFECSQKMSQIAMINDVAIRRNTMEMVMGNPDLKPHRVIEHLLRMTLTRPGLMAMLQGYVKLNPNSNLHHITRTEDDMFVDKQLNQPHCNLVMGMAYAQYDIVPQHLTASASAAVFLCDNKGIDYRHRHTTFNGTASLNAYLGRWTLSAYFDSGFGWMEGETRGRNGADLQLSASCQAGPLTLSLYCRNPFRAHPVTLRSEMVSAYLHKEVVIRNGDAGNYVGVNVSLKLQRGRKYRDIQRSISLRKPDAGILRK